ncbi:MAG TPA: PilZ domain-containing protein [Polyangiaceae bacterium]
MRMLRVLRRPFTSLLWRRAYERDRRSLTVDWHRFGSEVHRVSTTDDVSEGGVFLSTSAPLPMGSPVVMHFTLGGSAVLVHGRVAWRSTRGMGVRFGSPIEVGVA